MKAFETSRLWLAMGLSAAALAGCGGGGSSGGAMVVGGGAGMGASTGSGTSYAMTSLVSNFGTGGPYSSGNTDRNLVNGWGIAFNPNGFVWVADEGTSKSTLYDGHGVPQSLVVSIPAGAAGSADPTGIVFNDSSDFAVTQAGKTGASVFIFVGEGGTIAGWSPGVNMNAAITVFDGASAGKIYMGTALARSGGANRLYATDFHNRSVDVFDASFNKVSVPGGFVDPALPAGYAPFGIQAIGNSLYVTYAQQDPQGKLQVTGAGLGIVDVFDTDGHLLNRLIGAGGPLNAPWGIAMAPANFGAFSNDLLVANLGDGVINAFNPTTGAFLGALTAADGTPIAIDGLWGIAFGNGLDNQPTNTLFFAAGPAQYAQGVYGRIDTQ
jgi:uncharacterized protein (TIGR03118 family)